MLKSERSELHENVNENTFSLFKLTANFVGNAGQCFGGGNDYCG